MDKVKTVTVFCASSTRVDEKYLQLGYDLGQKLAEKGKDILYGGGSIGLMGSLADGTISRGGKVTGVIPSFLKDLELDHKGVHEMLVVPDMHTREVIMIRRADAIIVLPGSVGTFDELFQAIVWKKLGKIICPIIIVNFNRYFDPILEMYRKAIEEKFMTDEMNLIIDVVDTLDDALILIEKPNYFRKDNPY